MNFNELVSGATVRFTFIGGVQYLSVRDLIMVLCDKDVNQAGEVWRRLDDDRKSELQASCLTFKFSGRGQQEQPVITFQGAMKLMMALPGENAKKLRTKAAEILTRYFAGDKTLLREIEANAASDAPVNQMARAAVSTKTHGVDLEAQTLKKLKLDNVATFVKFPMSVLLLLEIDASYMVFFQVFPIFFRAPCDRTLSCSSSVYKSLFCSCI